MPKYEQGRGSASRKSAIVAPLFLLLLLAASSFVVKAQQPGMMPADVKARLTASVARSAGRLGYALDPAITEGIANNAFFFSSNFCASPTGPGHVDNCAATLGAPAVLDRLVSAMLQEMATTRPAEIQTIAGRLANAVGTSMAQAGWPDYMSNQVAVVTLPAELRSTTIALQTAGGPVVLGRNAQLILLSPGSHSLLLTLPDGTRQMRSVQLAALSRTALSPVAPPGASQSAGLGRIDPPNAACQPVNLRFEGPYAFFNWGRALIDQDAAARAANLTTFATQRALDIRIFEQPRGLCTGDCLNALSIAFAQAIAVWRSGCDRCTGNSLATIRIGRSVWLDARAVSRLRLLRGNRLPARSLDLTTPVVGEVETQRVNWAFMGPSAALVSYIQVDGDPEISGALCALADNAAPWVGASKTLLCAGGSGVAGPLRPIVMVRSDATSCGPAADFIACAVVGGNVELALEGTRFQFQGTRGPFELGTPGGFPVNGFQVVLHEVGHWFGLPHVQDVSQAPILDIMSNDMGGGCISEGSLVMLNNAADRRWQFRVSGNQGLRRPRRSR